MLVDPPVKSKSNKGGELAFSIEGFLKTARDAFNLDTSLLCMPFLMLEPGTTLKYVNPAKDDAGNETLDQIQVNFADPLRFATLGITAAVTPGQGIPSNERAHIEIRGRYLEWWGSLAWNRSDFYDIFGPTKRSRKGFAARGGYEHYIIYDEPRRLEFLAQAAFYDNIDTLPYAQNIESGFDRLTEAEVGLRYQDVRRSLGAVDDEKGIRWTAFAGVQHVTGETPWYVRGNLDYGWDLPLRNSSLTGGRLSVGEEVELHPTGNRARIRGLQTHKRAIEIARPVSRVAVNLVGTEREELERGHVVSPPGLWRPTRVLEARVHAVRGLAHPLTSRGAYKLHAGSAERDASLGRLLRLVPR